MSYTINGQAQNIPAPVERDGVTYLPLAKVVETLGGYVTWMNAAKTVSIELGEQKVEVQEGSGQASRDGAAVPLSGAPFNEGGTIWVPADFFSGALGCSVDVTGEDVTVSST